MRRRANIVIALTATLLVVSAGGPGGGGPARGVPFANFSKGPSSAVAQVQASGGGGGAGGGNVRNAGQRLGQLLTGWVVPVMFGLAGIFILGSLARREVGGAVAVVVICVLAGFFLLTPNVVESLIKGIANYVF